MVNYFITPVSLIVPQENENLMCPHEVYFNQHVNIKKHICNGKVTTLYNGQYTQTICRLTLPWMCVHGKLLHNSSVIGVTSSNCFLCVIMKFLYPKICNEKMIRMYNGHYKWEICCLAVPWMFNFYHQLVPCDPLVSDMDQKISRRHSSSRAKQKHGGRDKKFLLP